MPVSAHIYLDANAGEPVLPEVRRAVAEALTAGGNASSIHRFGRMARATIEEARQNVAKLVGALPENVTFTSGATEALNTALSPVMEIAGQSVKFSQLYVGATEHVAVLEGGRFSAESVIRLPVRPDGVINLDELSNMLKRDGGRPLVAIMLANNETGVIHPVAEAAEIVRSLGGVVVCDAVQAIGRLPVDLATLGADLVAISGHKIGGPQGSGALVTTKDVLVPPLLRGGRQENGRRAGTEDVPAIAGFGVAAEHAAYHLQETSRIRGLRDEFETELSTIAPDAVIAGQGVDRLCNTSLFVIPGIAAETAVIAFDLAGVYVSSGSACSSGKVGPSHVLAAQGWPEGLARGGVRISLPHAAAASEVERTLDVWRRIYPRLQQQHAA